MGFRSAVIYNYISHIYTILLGIISAPIYLYYLGADAYGLVAFGASLQLFLQLFDLGLTSVVMREVAKGDFSPRESAHLPKLLKNIRTYYIAIGLIVCVSTYFFSNLIAQKWLSLDGVDTSLAIDAIKVIGILIVLRWGAGIGRSILAGAQDFRWLSTFNIFISTLGFFAAILVLNIKEGLLAFLFMQVAHATVELTLIFFRSRKKLHSITSIIPLDSPLRFNGRDMIFFGASLTLTSTLWIFTSQFDRLLLSKFLPLAEFSYFVLTVTLASGIGTISAPLGNILLPKLTQLRSNEHRKEFLDLYLKSTELLCVIIFPLAATFAFFPQSVLYAWTGNLEMAKSCSELLMIYSSSAVFVSLCTFQYYMQFAHGKLGLHITGHLIYGAISIPALIYAARNYGASGVGIIYLIMNGSYFFFWMSFVHNKFYRQFHRTWLKSSIFPVLVSTCLIAFILRALLEFDGQERAVILGKLILVGCMIFTGALMSIQRFRQFAFSHITS